jgi:transketolase
MTYAWILENANGPAMLSLTRQDVDAIERCEPFELRDVWRGGYAVRQPASGKPDVIVAASGSEVSLACKAAAELAAVGIDARVVSMPCIELYLEQPQAYQDSLIPDDGTPLVAVEASRATSFRALLGRRALIWGIDTFGASAPYRDLAEHFGFVPDKLAAAIRMHVEQG